MQDLDYPPVRASEEQALSCFHASGCTDQALPTRVVVVFAVRVLFRRPRGRPVSFSQLDAQQLHRERAVRSTGTLDLEWHGSAFQRRQRVELRGVRPGSDATTLLSVHAVQITLWRRARTVASACAAGWARSPFR